MTRLALEELLQNKVDPNARVLSLTGDTHGLVLWVRPDDDTREEFIVHRWAVQRTDGSAIDGGMFWSGGYYLTEDEARADYDRRPVR